MGKGPWGKPAKKQAAMLIVGAAIVTVALTAVALLLPPTVDARLVKVQPGEAVLSDDDLGWKWQRLQFVEQPGNASQNLVGAVTIGIGNYTMPSLDVLLTLLVYDTIEDAEAGFNSTVEGIDSMVAAGLMDYEPVDIASSIGDEAARYEATYHFNKTIVQQFLVFRQQNVVCIMRVILTEPLPSEDLMMTFATAQDEKLLRLLEQPSH